MQLNQILHNGKSQTKSAVAVAALGLPERFKQMLQALCGDSFTRVFDAETKKRFCIFQCGSYRSALRRKLERIRNQIPDNLLKALGSRTASREVAGIEEVRLMPCAFAIG